MPLGHRYPRKGPLEGKRPTSMNPKPAVANASDDRAKGEWSCRCGENIK